MICLNKLITLSHRRWYCKTFHVLFGSFNNTWYCKKCDIHHDKKLIDKYCGPN